MRDPNMAAATLVGAQADAMKAAASNDSGAMMGFMGMGMAQQAGGSNAGQLFGIGGGQPQQTQPGMEAAPGGGFPAPAAPVPAQPAAPQEQAAAPQAPQPVAPQADAGWACAKCGKAGNTGKFCSECGAPAPVPQDASWNCAKCGKTGNTGNFCSECATPRP